MVETVSTTTTWLWLRERERERKKQTERSVIVAQKEKKKKKNPREIRHCCIKKQWKKGKVLTCFFFLNSMQPLIIPCPISLHRNLQRRIPCLRLLLPPLLAFFSFLFFMLSSSFSSPPPFPPLPFYCSHEEKGAAADTFCWKVVSSFTIRSLIIIWDSWSHCLAHLIQKKDHQMSHETLLFLFERISSGQ